MAQATSLHCFNSNRLKHSLQSLEMRSKNITFEVNLMRGKNYTMGYKNQFYEETEELLLEEELIDIGAGEIAELIVYNDDHNTFDWVIKCFMEVLKHTHEQAEQLSLIIHFKGKATVKTAPKNVLRPKKDALVDRGLSAVIEDIKK